VTVPASLMPAELFPGLSSATLITFLLVLTRTGSWVVAAPVFSAKGVAGVARIAVAVALSLFLTPLVQTDAVPLDLAGFAVAAFGQAAVGLALGFLTSLLFSAFEVAGTLADLASGFSYASIVDPLSGQPAAAFSRLFGMAFSAVFFATSAYQTVLVGFLGSFQAVPLGRFPHLTPGASAALGHAATQVVASAVQVAAPLLGVLFLTDVALSVASRFVPSANAMATAMPVKTLVALTVAGATLTLLPGHAAGLLGPAGSLPYEVIR
jgi:flagellar biosynthetic protein FliR